MPYLPWYTIKEKYPHVWMITAIKTQVFEKPKAISKIKSNFYTYEKSFFLQFWFGTLRNGTNNTLHKIFQN